MELHPLLNAILNATSCCLLIAGYRAIRAGNRVQHQKMMVGAFATSTVFLISYLLRFALTGTHKYPGNGWDKILYLVILFSHMVLAVAVVPLILRSLWLAYQQKFVEHKKLVKITWPIWLYVSVTGVVVYLMLYHIGPGLH
jgi:putative membrane protein